MTIRLEQFHQAVRDPSLANYSLVPFYEKECARLEKEMPAQPKMALIRKDLESFKTESREKLTKIQNLSSRIDDLSRLLIKDGYLSWLEEYLGNLLTIVDKIPDRFASAQQPIQAIVRNISMLKASGTGNILQLVVATGQVNELAKELKKIGLSWEKKYDSAWGPAQLKKIQNEIQTIRKKAEEIADHPSFRKPLEGRLSAIEEMLQTPQEELKQRDWTRLISQLYPYALGAAALLLIARAAHRAYSAGSPHIAGAAVSACAGIALGSVVYWGMNQMIQPTSLEPETEKSTLIRRSFDPQSSLSPNKVVLYQNLTATECELQSPNPILKERAFQKHRPVSDARTSPESIHWTAASQPLPNSHHFTMAAPPSDTAGKPYTLAHLKQLFLRSYTAFLAIREASGTKRAIAHIDNKSSLAAALCQLLAARSTGIDLSQHSLEKAKSLLYQIEEQYPRASILEILCYLAQNAKQFGILYGRG